MAYLFFNSNSLKKFVNRYILLTFLKFFGNIKTVKIKFIRRERMKKIFLITGFFIGLFSFCLLVLYVLAGIFYVFSDAPYCGDIAFISKWAFLPSPLIFLAKNNAVQEFLISLDF